MSLFAPTKWNRLNNEWILIVISPTESTAALWLIWLNILKWQPQSSLYLVWRFRFTAGDLCSADIYSSGYFCAHKLRHAEFWPVLPPSLVFLLGLSIDYAASKLYWISSANGTINRCNLDGGGLEVLESLKRDLVKGTALAVMGEWISEIAGGD